MKLNFSTSGYQISDEAHYDVGASKFILGHDLLMGGSNMEIWTGPGKTGVKLNENGDYYLEDEDTDYSAEAGVTVYTCIRVANPSYQTGALYISYKTLGDYVDSTSINNLTDIVTGSPQTIFNPSFVGVWPWINNYRRSADTTLGTGENNANSICYTGRSVIVGCDTAPAKIIRINNITNQEEFTLNLEASENNCQALLCDGQYVYAGLNTNPAKIIRIDPVTMERSPALVLRGTENNCTALTYDGTYIYAILGTSPCKIVKINPTSMTRVGHLDLGTGENVGKCGVIYGGHIYVGLGTTPGKVVKVSIDTFTKVSVCTLAAGENEAKCLGIANGHIYVGTNTNKLAQINPFTMTETNSYTLTASSTTAMTYDGLSLFLVGGGSSCYITKFDPRNNVVITTQSFAANTNSVTFDGISLFLGTGTTPGAVYQRSTILF